MENIPIGIPYVIDLDDHEASGIPTLIRCHANGEREQEMSPVMDGKGLQALKDKYGIPLAFIGKE